MNPHTDYCFELKENIIWSYKNFHAWKITVKYLGRSIEGKFNTYKIFFIKFSVCIVGATKFYFVDVESHKEKYYSSNR